MRLIGISGTNGSGKDSLGELLQLKYGYLFISVTDLLRIEAKKRGETTERAQLASISAEWRRAHGFGVLVDKAVDLYERQGGDATFNGLAIASLRHPGEADRVHELGGTVVWTDADAKVRYERIFARGRHDDKKSFEQFLAEEQAEMKQAGDSATLHMEAVKTKADNEITNNGTSMDAFAENIAVELKELL